MTLIGAAAVLAAALILFTTPIVDRDTLTDSLQSASRAISVVVVSSWPWLLVLAAAAILHYVFSALALRAAAGDTVPICWKEATRVQVVAAVVNRVTPSGLGGAAVNARFLAKCGQPASRSVGSVGAMHLFGGLAKSGLLLLLLATESATGKGGFSSLGKGPARLISHAPAASMPVILVGGAVLALVIGVTVCCRVRAVRAARRVRVAACQALEQITSMRRRPRDLAFLLLSAGGSTLMLALGLVVSVAAVSGLGSVGVNAVLVGYLVGSAVGTAVPTPSGIGSTEAALVGMLVATGLAAGPALSAVLLFRAITFWAPVPVGLLLARGLHRRHAL